ncbi:MAG TPA: hypothetical protein VGH99_17030 [Pseudonocardia sp.]
MSTTVESGQVRRRSEGSFAARHAWLVVLLLGTALFVADERTLVATRNPKFVPSAILLGAPVVPMAFLTFVYGRGLPYRVTLRSSPRPPSSAGSSARSWPGPWNTTSSVTWVACR